MAEKPAGTWRIRWLGGGAEEIRTREGPGANLNGVLTNRRRRRPWLLQEAGGCEATRRRRRAAQEHGSSLARGTTEAALWSLDVADDAGTRHEEEQLGCGAA